MNFRGFRLIAIVIAVSLPLILASCGKDEQQSETPRQPTTVKEPVQKAPEIEKTPDDPDAWTMFMGDINRTGRSRDTSVSDSLHTVWKFMTGGQVTASPVVWNNTVYIGSRDGRFYALKSDEWGERWSFDAGSPIRYSATIWGGRVFFHTENSTVYSLNAMTGELIWKQQIDNWINSPLIVSDGRVYAGVYDRKIYELDARRGDIRSKSALRKMIAGVEYVCTQGELRPLTPHNRAEEIRSRVPLSRSNPVTANGFVFIGSRKGLLHIFDEKTLEEVATFDAAGGIDSTPAIYKGFIYFGSLNGYVYALSSGETRAEDRRSSSGIGEVFISGRSPYYATAEAVEVAGYLNDGEILPLISVESGFYRVRLPNGRDGFLKSAVRIKRYDDHLTESDAIRRTEILLLKEGGEYPVWSPDGTVVAYPLRTKLKGQYWNADEIWITNPATGRSRKVCSAGIYNPNISWSLDSKWIAFEAYDSNTSHVYVISRDGSDLRRIAEGDSPAFSPTANRIAFRRRRDLNDALWVINLDRSDLRMIKPIPVLGTPQQYLYLMPPAWSPRGDMIAVATDAEYYPSNEAKLLLISLAAKEESKIIRTRAREIKEIAWSPSGDHIAYVLAGNADVSSNVLLDRKLVVRDTAEWKARSFSHALPAWSPDGRVLIFGENDEREGMGWKIWAYDVQTEKRRLIALFNAELSRIAWVDSARLTLWVTSRYLRDGQYLPAQTVGYIMEMSDLSSDE